MKAKTIACKLCGYRVPVTPGLPFLEDHWAEHHAEELEELHKRSGRYDEAEDNDSIDPRRRG